MTVNVKDRAIEINSELVAEYEQMDAGAVDELYILANLGVLYGKKLDDLWDSIPDEKIKSVTESAIREELDF
jgi:hypothetical protein